LRKESGRVLKLPERAVYERAEARIRTVLGEHGFAATRAAGRTLSREQAFTEAIALADEIALPCVDQRPG